MEPYTVRVDDLPPIEADVYELVYSSNGEVKTISGVLPEDTESGYPIETWLRQKLLSEG